MPMKDIIYGLVRHLLTWGGGAWLVSVVGEQGIESMAQLIAALLLAGIGAAWSIQDKRKR